MDVGKNGNNEDGIVLLSSIYLQYHLSETIQEGVNV